MTYKMTKSEKETVTLYNQSILFHFADVEKARFHPSSGIITTKKLDSTQNAILIKNLHMKT